MIGDKVGSGSGKLILRRILDSSPGGARMEPSQAGQGVGTFNEAGGVSFRGAVYMYSSSEKWQRLNRVATVYEYEVDADDNYTGELWEWK